MPTFIEASKEDLRVRIDDSLEIGANAILIGCAGNLRSIRPEDMERLRQLFAKIILENHYLLSSRRTEVKFRHDVVAQINATLGRRLIGDIFFHGIYSTEFGPG